MHVCLCNSSNANGYNQIKQTFTIDKKKKKKHIYKSGGKKVSSYRKIKNVLLN